MVMIMILYRPNKFYIKPDTFGTQKEKGTSLGFGPRLSNGMVVEGLQNSPCPM